MSVAISSEDPHPRRRVAVLDSEMSFVETGGPAQTGAGTGTGTFVFLHGNPTSSYLWRNVIPHLAPLGRCLAPDLIGMGGSGKSADGRYTFAEHSRYLDAWFDTVVPDGKLVLVLHDWGGGLGFHWARRHAERVAGIAYMETIVTPLSWDDWPDQARDIFQALRSPAGEDMILRKNLFVERILPASIIRDLGTAEMAAYRAPFAEPGELRRPTLSWPRQLPLDGEPSDVVETVADYDAWLRQSPIPKLFINAEPGVILVGRQRDVCRGWPNQREVTVPGLHFIQEDSPDAIGEALTAFAKGLDE